MVYVGVDLHRRVSQVSAIDEKGEVVLTRRIKTEPLEFLRVFGELEPGPMSVAFEATFGWGWFAELLKDAGVAAHMAHPRDTKAIANARVKNDAVDARTLAHLLRTELLPEAWMAPVDVREARRLVRMRGALVRIRSRLKNQVHAVLADQGVLFPMSDVFGALGREELARLQLPPLVQHRLEAHVRLIADITNEVNIADHEIRGLFKNDSRRNGCRRFLESGYSRRRPSWPRLAILLASQAPIISAPGQDLLPRNDRVLTMCAAAESPSRARGGCAGPWSKLRSRPNATQIFVLCTRGSRLEVDATESPSRG